MQAWAGIAIAQAALFVFSLWRVWRDHRAREGEDDEEAKQDAAAPEGAAELPAVRALWWPGVAIFVTASLALVVFIADGGRWGLLSLFGTVVLASDVVFLKGALVASLCTREVRA